MSIYEPQGHAFLSDEEKIEQLMEKQKFLQNLGKDLDPSEPYVVNMGPQHPSTHGVFRARLTMNGEMVLKCENICGYLHRGIEKICEDKTWAQVIPYTDRLDYLSPILNEWGYCMAVEKLMGVEVPERGEYVRVILGELQRVAHHLVYLASMALDFNGYTAWMYMFREREKIFDILEAYSGSRMNNNALRIGGAPTPLPEGLEAKIYKWLDEFPDAMRDFENVVNGNEIFMARTKNVGVVDAEMCKNYGVYGANLRAAGVKLDLRKDQPYSIYDRFDFDVPTGKQGDSFDRYEVRHREMAESAKIIRQALDQMPKEGPTMGKVPKMIKVPAGSAYTQIEGGMGWLGYHLVSDGGMKPYRVRIHAPSMMSLFAVPEVVEQEDMLLQDYVATLASIDIVLGEVDR
ncbi:MAG: NADH-quinone oxidoreductase subunit D [Peptococcaceae bacterium]|jgi:NADH-quinone oxidoreductase subunit D